MSSPSTDHVSMTAGRHAAGGRGSRSPRWPGLRMRGVLLSVVCAVPVVLVLLADRRGPGISPDSVTYASAARSLATAGHLTIYSGQPLTSFPPGLPVLLGLVAKVGLDIQVAAVVLNLFSLIAVVVATYLLTVEALGSFVLGLLAAAVVALSASTVDVFAMLWTEPSFTALALFVLWGLARSIHRRRLTAGVLAAVALGTSVAIAVRYVGVVLIPVVMLGAYLSERPNGRRRAQIRALIAGLAASLGFVVIAGRNLLLGVGPLGDRNPSTQSILHVGHETLRTLGAYMLPNRLHGLATIFGLGLVLVLCYGTVQVIRNRDLTMVLITTFIAVYWLVLWYSELTTLTDGVNDRLVAPIFGPMVILGMYAVRDFAGAASGERSPKAVQARPRLLSQATSLIILLALALLLVVEPLKAAKAAWAEGRGGIGYNSQAAQANTLTQALAALPKNAGVAATDPWSAYWVAQRDMALPIPSRYDYLPPAESLKALRVAAARGSVAYLAYFKNAIPAMQPSDLAKAGIFSELVASYPDGMLYRLTTSSPQASQQQVAGGG